MKEALLISSEDPNGRGYEPDNKWDLFRERISTQGSALWGINAGKPQPGKIRLPCWAYVVVKGREYVDVRMRVKDFIPSPKYPERAALPNDPRRIPEHRNEPWKLFLEVDALETVKKPLFLEELEKTDGGKVKAVPQGMFTYIWDPYES